MDCPTVEPLIQISTSFSITSFKRQLGQRIFALRKAARMTQSELGEAAGVGNEYISKIERGLGSPSLATLVKIALALQVEMKALFDFGMGWQGGPLRQGFLKLSSVLKNLSEPDLDLVYRLAKRFGKR